jgi:hypothetical protein
MLNLKQLRACIVPRDSGRYVFAAVTEKSCGPSRGTRELRPFVVDSISTHDIACLRASLMKRERNDGNTNRVSTPRAATCPLTRLASTYWDLAASSDDNF